MKQKEILRNILKVVLLIAILVISYLICMLFFLSYYGTGGQGSEAMNNGFGVIIIVIPLIITFLLGFKLFKKK